MLAIVPFALILRAHAAESAADPATAGRSVFHACQACHALDARGTSDAGPTLYGLFGRKAGTAERFGYSDAMKNSAIVWSESTLDAFLRNPQGSIPANAMPFGGVSDAAQRALLIAYLRIATTPLSRRPQPTER